jgi:hypothetical protein
MRNEKINLAEKLAQFIEHWTPRTVAQLNDCDIMAEEETHLLLIEPSGTPNTGNAATAAQRRTI